MAPAAVDILGIHVNPLSWEQALTTIKGWIERRERQYVCVCTVHTVMEAHDDPSYRAIINSAGLRTTDGMPLLWLSRRAGIRHAERIYGPDLMLKLCERSVRKGYRHYFYGGAPGVARELARRMQERFPGLQVAGWFEPPFRPLTSDEDRQVVAEINTAAPDVVWVGLGTPKQDQWMAEHRPLLTAPALIGVGAAFDFHTGRVAQAPVWMRNLGLEWFYRLCREPRRLWRRYLIGNGRFCLRLLQGTRRHVL